MTTEAAELASSMCWDLGATAIAEQDILGGVLLTVGFEDDEATKDAAGELQEEWTLEIVAVTNDGLDAWKEFAEPIRVGSRFVLEPAWQTPGDWEPNDLVLRLDAKRVFGSGSHVTTRLCLEALEGRVRMGGRTLDLGAGSGVLGLGALLLGAESVVMVDVDQDAKVAIDANAATNKLTSSVESFHSTVAEVSGTFDLIVANILVGALVELAPSIDDLLEPGGHLIISGLWGSQWKRLLLLLEGMQLLSRTTEEGWSCLELQKIDPSADDDRMI